MAVNLDTLAIAYADELLSCLCSLLDGTVGGPVCQCTLHPGTAPPPADYCCGCAPSANGQAWVMVTRIFPTINFPNDDTESRTCCRNEWGVELTMGVYRCVSVPDSRGTPPSADQLRADAEKILDDAAAMRRAVVCCLSDSPLFTAGDIVPGAWTPLASSGGCGGGSMTVTLRATDCCP